MTILVIGKNSSGKIAYAERLAASLCRGQLYYIATMLPYGEDGAERVKKHRAQRAGMGFFTLESPYGKAKVSKQDTVLLEDVSNLVANYMFEQKVPDTAAAAIAAIEALRNACNNLILVSISGIDAADGGDENTRAYIAALNGVNEQLANGADVVIEMLSGQPIVQKGALPC